MKKNRRERRQYLISALDTETGAIVKDRARLRWGQCPFCWFESKHGAITDWFHYFGREHKGTRWELMNGEGSCNDCNTKYEQDVKFQKKIKDFFIDLHGEDMWNMLNSKFHTVTKYSNEDLEDMLQKLRQQRKENSCAESTTEEIKYSSRPVRSNQAVREL